MAKKTKAKLSVADKSDKGKERKDEMRGRIVKEGFPLWLQNSRKRHLQFKAGKMYVIDNMVHPDPRKGYVCIDQDEDHVMHFCWMERDTVGAKEEDLTPEPYDSIFKRVQKCTTGRVYILKMRSTNKNYFFWMQEPSAEKDSEICAKVNYLLNFPPPWLRFPQIACNFEVQRSSNRSSEYDSAESESNTDDVGEPDNVEMGEMDHSQAFPKTLQDQLPALLLAYEANIATRQETLEDVNPQPVLGNVDWTGRLEGMLSIIKDGTTDSVDNSVRSRIFAGGKSASTGTVCNAGQKKLLRNLGFNKRTRANGKRSMDEFSSDSDSEYSEVADTGDMKRKTFEQTYANKNFQDPGPSRERDPWNSNLWEIAAALAGNGELKRNDKTTKVPTTDAETPTKYEEPVDVQIAVPTSSKGNHEQEEPSEQSTAPSESETEIETLDDWESTTEPNFDSHLKSRDAIRANPPEKDTQNQDNATYGITMDLAESWQSVRCPVESHRDNKDSMRSTPTVEMMNDGIVDTEVNDLLIARDHLDVTESLNVSNISSREVTLSDYGDSSEGSLWKSASDLDTTHHNSRSIMGSTTTIEIRNNLQKENVTSTEIIIDQKPVAMKKNLRRARRSNESPHKETSLVDKEGSTLETQDHVGTDIVALQVNVGKETTSSDDGDPTLIKDETNKMEMMESIEKTEELEQAATSGSYNFECDSRDAQEGPHATKDINDISNCGTIIHQNEDRKLAESENSQDRSISHNIAMMVLVPSVSSESAEKKQPTKAVSSDANKRPKIHTSENNDQCRADLLSRSIARLPNSAKANNDDAAGQDATNGSVSGIHDSKSKKLIAPSVSKSLEDVTYVSGPYKEARYNLRKRPLQQVCPSQSGPSMITEYVQGKKSGLGKKQRMSSPGVPLPVPFRVPEASPCRSSRSRHPLGAGLVSELNQGNVRNSRKRVNEDEASDSDLDATPSKKARTSDDSNPSKDWSSITRQHEGLSSTAGSKNPPSRFVGSESTPDQPLNVTPRGSIVNNSIPNDSSQNIAPSPRYNLRRHSTKIEDGQQTEPVRIREVRKAGTETIVRTHTLPRALPGPPPVNSTNRDRSQNTRPVIVEDKTGSKSKSKARNSTESDRRPTP